MIDIKEITINEFEETIYDKYVTLFPENEQRYWSKITETYNKGIEKFYKITNNSITIGFFMLERIDETYPYYIDYFAIFKEYQNKGLGTITFKKLIEKLGGNGLCFEIEKEDSDKPHTIKRAAFYKKLGFQEVKSEYSLYGVIYTPYVYINNKYIGKNQIDKIMFDYYTTNAGKSGVNKHCSIIK